MTRPQLIAWLTERAELCKATYEELGDASHVGAEALEQHSKFMAAAEMLADDAFRLQHLNEALLNAR